jgi:acyl carrier protein
LFGNIGQVNYVAANSYLESLISKRRNNGLKGNYIAFGGITDTGLLARNKKLKKILSSQMGNGLITVKQALLTLERLMSQDEVAGFAVMDISVQQMEKQMALFTTSRFDVLRHSEKRLHISEDSDYKEYIKSLDPEDARNELIQLVREEISYIVEMPLDKISHKTSVRDLGFDSLMGADLAVAIEKRIGISVPSLSLQREPNAENIAEIILPRLVGETVEDEDFESVLYEKHGEEVS